MQYMVLVIFGFACGSFVNALVWRVHEQEEEKEKEESRKKKAESDPRLSILKGRSMCPHCKHELAAKDLIPVLSWVSLGGKCRYCKKPISAQYPLVELLTAGLFALSYYFLDLDPALILLWLLMLTGLMALFVYDLKWMILPDRIVFPMIGLASAFRIYEFILGDSAFDPVISAALGALVLGGLFYLLFIVSNGRWIGGGDVKLGIFIGILLGPALAYLVLLVASLLGSVIILGFMATKAVKRNQQVPFGPFLITGTYIAMVWGQQAIDWYSQNFLGGLL